MLALMQVVVPDNSPIWLVLLATVFPILSGWLSNLVMDGVKNLSAKIDTAPALVKQIISIAIAALVGFASSKLGATVDPDLHNWTATSVNMLLTALASAGIYKWKSDNQAAAQGTPTLSQMRKGVPKKLA